MTLVDIRSNALNYIRDFSAIDSLATVKKDVAATQPDGLDAVVNCLLNLSYKNGDPIVDVNTVHKQPTLTETQKRMVVLVNEIIIGHNAPPVSIGGKPILDLIGEDTAKAFKEWADAVNRPINDRTISALIGNMIEKANGVIHKYKRVHVDLKIDYKRILDLTRQAGSRVRPSPTTIDFNGVSVPLGSKVLIKDAGGNSIGEGELTNDSILTPSFADVRLIKSSNPAYILNQSYAFRKDQLTPLNP